MSETAKVIALVAGCIGTLVTALYFTVRAVLKHNRELTGQLIGQVVTEARRGNDLLVQQGRDLTSSLREQTVAIQANTAENARCTAAVTALAHEMRAPTPTPPAAPQAVDNDVTPPLRAGLYSLRRKGI